MIEIDPGIISAGELLNKIELSAAEKQIPKKFYNGELGRNMDKARRKYMDKLLVSIKERLADLNKSYSIVEQPIRSDRPVVGKLIVAAKKVYRKLTRWIFASYYNQQTAINAKMTSTLNEISELQELIMVTYNAEKKGE